MLVDFVYSLFCKFVFFFFFFFILFHTHTHTHKKDYPVGSFNSEFFFLNYCYKAASSFTMSHA